MREIADRRILAMPAGHPLVLTNALLLESAREREAWDAVKKLAAQRSDRLVAVTLECSVEENVRRVASEDRRHRKMIDPAPLLEWQSKYTLLTDPTVCSLTIDNTDRTADQVANEILAFVRGSA